jgi:protoheme IX farnesyltransferase
MLPVVAGAEATRRQMLLYTLVLLPLAPLPALLGVAGVVYAGLAGLLGLLFVACALDVLRARDERAPKRMFGFSILYLFLLFAALIVDRAPGLLPGLLPGLAG